MFLLALLAVAYAQLDLSDRNEIGTDATIYLHVEVDQIFYRKTTPNTTAESLVMTFEDVDIQLPIKDDLDAFEASTTKHTSPYFFSADTCLRTSWNSSGSVALPAKHVMVDESDTYIYQYIDYADVIMYSDFERPFFSFEANAFVQTNPSTSCRPNATVDVVEAHNFTNQLCYTESSFCNVWIGDSSDGWLYWGGSNTKATAKYGVKVNPRWTWNGTRRSFELNATNFLDVRGVDSSSDSSGQEKLSRTHSVPFEFEECIVQEDGALLFHINENGFLERYMSCNSLVLKPYSYFVFDFNDEFDEKQYADAKIGSENRWNLTFYPFRVKYGSSYEIEVDPAEYTEPLVKLNRLPKDYYLDGAQWLTTLELNSGSPDRVKTWFTITKTAAVPTTVATTARPATTPVVVPVCPMACNGKGRCQPGNMCVCDDGFVTDATQGCKALETTAATTAGAPVVTAVTQPVVAPSTKAIVATTEPMRTLDPKAVTGTFTGTKAPTAPRPTQAVVTTTAPTPTSATSLVFSSVVVLLAVALAL